MARNTNTILAWHFTHGTTLRDGRAIPADGVKLRQTGKIIPRENGLHGSIRLIDALKYAPGGTLHRTEHSGTIRRDGDKIASSVRCSLWRIDAEPILRSFARQCALDVAHLRDMPAIVRQYPETGDETIRAAAWAAAARDAAWAAAWTAARRAAARDVAWAAAWAAARDAQNTRLEAAVIAAHESAIARATA
jgi:hypothetical protein